jgi:hypothetical protein
MTREGLVDREGESVGRVLAAVARSATTRIANDVRILSTQGESYTLAWPLITDVTAALAVPVPLVVAAIDEGVKTGVLRVVRDGDGQLVAVRADPL